MADGKKSLQAGTHETARDPQVDRRDALRTLGRFAAVTPPTVGLLLAAASRPVHAVITSECPEDDRIDDCIPEN